VVPAPGLLTASTDHRNNGLTRRPGTHFQPGTGAPPGVHRLTGRLLAQKSTEAGRWPQGPARVVERFSQVRAALRRSQQVTAKRQPQAKGSQAQILSARQKKPGFDLRKRESGPVLHLDYVAASLRHNPRPRNQALTRANASRQGRGRIALGWTFTGRKREGVGSYAGPVCASIPAASRRLVLFGDPSSVLLPEGTFGPRKT